MPVAVSLSSCTQFTLYQDLSRASQAATCKQMSFKTEQQPIGESVSQSWHAKSWAYTTLGWLTTGNLSRSQQGMPYRENAGKGNIVRVPFCFYPQF